MLKKLQRVLQCSERPLATLVKFKPSIPVSSEVYREVKIDVYDRPVTANAKPQVGFSGEVLAVRN